MTKEKPGTGLQAAGRDNISGKAVQEKKSCLNQGKFTVHKGHVIRMNLYVPLNVDLKYAKNQMILEKQIKSQ